MGKLQKIFHPLEVLANAEGNWAEFQQQFPGFCPAESALPQLRALLRKGWTYSDQRGEALEELLGFRHDIAKLPECRPTVEVSGAIEWEFASEFQKRLHGLLCTEENWRARVCLQCGKYFVATEKAQKHCAFRCYLIFKRKRSRLYWHSKGERIRKRKRAAERRKHGTK
jgi:hypothetical protein